MTKKLIAIRASDLTLRQITELQERLGVSQTELVTLAIDRLYREEIQACPSRQAQASESGKSGAPTCAGRDEGQK